MNGKRIICRFIYLAAMGGATLQANAVYAVDVDDLDITITVIESETDDTRAITRELSLPFNVDRPRAERRESEPDADTSSVSARTADEAREEASDDARDEIRDLTGAGEAQESAHDAAQDLEEASEEARDDTEESRTDAEESRDSSDDAHEESSDSTENTEASSRDESDH